MTRILILGAGGHAQVVADAVLANARHNHSLTLAGFLDDNPALHGQTLLGMPIWGRIDDLAGLAHEAVVIGIGDNVTRANLFTRLQTHGEKFVVVVHPRATELAMRRFKLVQWYLQVRLSTPVR